MKIVRVGDDIVAFYAVLADDGVTLVDAGLPGDMTRLVDALGAHGRSIVDVRAVILTHGDSDHLGVAEQLRSRHGVTVFVHEADAVRARGGKKPAASAGGFSLLAALRFFAVALKRGGLRTRYLTRVSTFAVEPGAPVTLDVPGRPEVIAMPGHSPGSVAVRIAAANALFVGDALTTRHVMTGVCGVQPAPFTDDPVGASASVASLGGLAETHVYPGHGPAFVGPIAQLIADYGRGSGRVVPNA